jgi:hypothetical protein
MQQQLTGARHRRKPDRKYIAVWRALAKLLADGDANVCTERLGIAPFGLLPDRLSNVKSNSSLPPSAVSWAALITGSMA